MRSTVHLKFQPLKTEILRHGALRTRRSLQTSERPPSLPTRYVLVERRLDSTYRAEAGSDLSWRATQTSETNPRTEFELQILVSDTGPSPSPCSALTLGSSCLPVSIFRDIATRSGLPDLADGKTRLIARHRLAGFTIEWSSGLDLKWSAPRKRPEKKAGREKVSEQFSIRPFDRLIQQFV